VDEITVQLESCCFQDSGFTNPMINYVITATMANPEVKVSRNGPEHRSGKRIIAGTAFRLEFLVGWYYDADATIAVPELY